MKGKTMIMANDKPLSEAEVDEVIARYPDRTGDMLGIMETLQEMHPLHYLPRSTMEMLARKTGLALSNIFSVATFYSFFNLNPQGRRCVMVCRGTACHTRGSKALMDGVIAAAGVTDPHVASLPTYTTPDYALTVRTVACFGQCALAPVVAVDHEIYGHMTDLKLRRIVRDVIKKDAADENN